MRVTYVALDRCISACVHVPYQESVLVPRVTNLVLDRCISACVHVPYQESVLVPRVTNIVFDRCISACVHVPYQESVLVPRVTNVVIDRCISACVHVPYQESVLVPRVTNVVIDRCISACVHVPYHAIPHRHHRNMRARICTHTLVTHIADVLNVMPQVTGARRVVDCGAELSSVAQRCRVWRSSNIDVVEKVYFLVAVYNTGGGTSVAEGSP